MKKEEYPALYQDASRASAEAQSAFLAAIKWHGIMSVVAAVLATYSGTNRFLVVLGALLILSVLTLSLVIRYKRFEKAWYKARTTAESIKTIAWRFMVRAEPYEGDDAVEKFCSRLESILQDEELATHLAGNSCNKDQITSGMSEIRFLPLAERKEKYRTDRIQEQRNWYQQKISYNKRKSKQWFIALVVLNAAAVLCLLVSAAKPELRLPTEGFLVAGSACLAWMQVRKFAELSAAYSVTAHEIGLIQGRLQSVTDEDGFSQFVGDAESAFSREHTSWIARQST